MIASTQASGPSANVKDAPKAPDPLDLARSRMRSAGLRITRPRLAILSALLSSDEPASVEQVHGRVGAACCDIVTVYRCMAALGEIGLVRRAYLPDGACLYEAVLGRPARYPIVCRKSRCVRHIDAAAAGGLGEALRGVEEMLRAGGYTDVGHVVEFFGTAPAAGPGTAQDRPHGGVSPAPAAGAASHRPPSGSPCPSPPA